MIIGNNKNLWVSLGNTAVMRKEHMAVLISSLCCSMFLWFFWFFKITFTYSVTSFQYTTTTSVCMYGYASRPLLTMLNSERRQQDGDWHGLFFFSDIPRIPDTSHPPLESSKFLLWDVGTYIHSYLFKIVSHFLNLHRRTTRCKNTFRGWRPESLLSKCCWDFFAPW